MPTSHPLSPLEVAAVLHDAVARLESGGVPPSAAVAAVAWENGITANAVRAALTMVSREQQREGHENRAAA